jgi:hypothetical protein
VSDERQRRVDWALRSSQLVAAIALATVAIALYKSVSLWVGGDKIVELRRSQLLEIQQRIAAHDEQLQDLSQQIGTALDRQNLASSEDLDLATVAQGVEANSNRLSKLEGAIELEPTEVIAIVRLRDQLVDIRANVEVLSSELSEEIGRMYTLILSSVGGLLFAIALLLLQNVFSKKGNEE